MMAQILFLLYIQIFGNTITTQELETQDTADGGRCDSDSDSDSDAGPGHWSPAPAAGRHHDTSDSGSE